MDRERLSHPGTVTEGSYWTFPGKFRIWARVPEPALLPASHVSAALAPHIPLPAPHKKAQSHRHSACPHGDVGPVPRHPPQGTHGSRPAGSCQAFHPKPGPCVIQSANKRSDRHSKITSSSRGRVAGDWLLVWPEKRLQRKGVSLAAMSSTKCWAGHCHCSAGAEAAQPSRDSLRFAGSGPLSPRRGGGVPFLGRGISVRNLEQRTMVSSNPRTSTISPWSPPRDTFPPQTQEPEPQVRP